MLPCYPLGFQLSRNSLSFTDAYSPVLGDACGRSHAPSDIYDDMIGSQLIPGNSYRYTVIAFTRDTIRWDDSAGLRSNPTTLVYRARWEASVSGYVRLESAAGNLGVGDVRVAYNLSSGLVTGFTTTDSDGFFTINFKTLGINGLVPASVQLNFSKTTVAGDESVEHVFEYNSVATSVVTIKALQPLTFDTEITVIDTTSLPIRGSVFVAGTGADDRWDTQHNANADPSAFRFGCPLENVTVCIFAINQQAQLGCTATDAGGSFCATAKVGEIAKKSTATNPIDKLIFIPFFMFRTLCRS